MTVIAPNPLASASKASAFIQSYWQQQAGVIRSALDADEFSELNRRRLLEIAGQDDAESRLIQRNGRQWQLTDGPLLRRDIPAASEPNWTVLVQGVDLHLPAARNLLDRFRFIPDARLDDVMISIASTGGGVGPHVDDYDVFLLQLAGKRRWRIAPPATYQARRNQPLKLISQFTPSLTTILSPGDMLYLPPGWAHDGIAVDGCVTASIGFRAPASTQLQAAFMQDLADQLMLTDNGGGPRYGDQRTDAASLRQWRTHPAQIPPAMMMQLSTWLQQVSVSDAQCESFIGRYLSEPKPGVWFERPQTALTAARLRGSAIVLDRKTRMLWFGRQVFINGESLAVTGSASRLLRQLADQRRLSADQTRELINALQPAQTLSEWQAAGWLHRQKRLP